MEAPIPPPSEVIKEETASPVKADAEVKIEETDNASATPVPEQLTTTSRIAIPPPPKKKAKTSRSSTPNLGGDLEPLNTSSSDTKPPPFPAELNEADVVGGAELRRWFNTEITYELVAALKEISKVRPENPLRWLGQRLMDRAEEKASQN